MTTLVSWVQSLGPSLASWVLFFRPVITTLVMASSSFVLGTVVSYQYHVILLGLPSEPLPRFEKIYRERGRIFYMVGFVAGLVIAKVVDSLTSSPVYYLALGFVVFICWVLWCAWISCDTETWHRIRTKKVHWEWFVSIIATSFMSAAIGATLLIQWFGWIGWRSEPLRW
jgi:hypothetical protein